MILRRAVAAWIIWAGVILVGQTVGHAAPPAEQGLNGGQGPREVIMLGGGTPYWVNPTAAGITGSVDCYPVVSQSCYVTGTGLVPMSSLMSLLRASAETYTNASGVLSYASSGVLASGNAGLQVFGGSTNLNPYSNALASWSSLGSGITVTNNAALSPDGTNNAASVVAISTGNTYATEPLAVVASSTYTASIYLLPVSGSGSVWFSISDQPQTNGCILKMTQSGRTLSYVSTTVAGTGTCFGTASVTLLPNNWYYLIVSGTVPTTIGAVILDGFNTIGQTVQAFCAQIELGAFPTPCIPTTSTTAARATDIITATGALATALQNNVGAFYSQTNNIMNPNNNLTRILGLNGSQDYQYNGSPILGMANSVSSCTSGYLGRIKGSATFNGTQAKVICGTGTAGGLGSDSSHSGTWHVGSSSDGTAPLNGNLERLIVIPGYFGFLPTTGTGAWLLDPANDNDFAWLYDLITERTAS